MASSSASNSHHRSATMAQPSSLASLAQQQLTPSSVESEEGSDQDLEREGRLKAPARAEDAEREKREREIQRRIKSLPCPGCEQHNDGIRAKSLKEIEEAETHQHSSIPASSAHAEQHLVMPFLTEHIPVQYNSVGSGASPWVPQEKVQETVQNKSQQDAQQERTSTKFCYRHAPDLKCRRQVDEPSMKELQNELGALSQSDQQAISHVWSLFSAAPAKHRNLMLQGILTQCCFPQLSYITSAVRDLIKIDFLSALPDELGFKILCYLDTGSLCKAAQVSQRWRTLADDDVVWHRMCEQHIDRKCTKCGWGLPLLERKRLRIEKRQIQLRASQRALDYRSPPMDINLAPERETNDSSSKNGARKRAIEESSHAETSNKRQCSEAAHSEDVANAAEDASYFASFPSNRRPWKDVYKARFKVGTNWKHGRFSTKVFRGHTNGVMCLQFDSDILISGSYDSTAKVWDMHTGAELRTLKGHTSGIRCLQFDETKLMTGSLDNTLRLWNWKTGQCLRVFQAHSGGILALHFAGPWVASGSMDQTIRVWNSETQHTFLLRGHTDSINCVRLDEASRTLFSASDDLTVRLWDLESKQCIKVFEGHVGPVQQVISMPTEFELDERRPAASERDLDDDAASDASVPSATNRHHDRRVETPAPEDERPPFWPNDPYRPAPPRYMLTGALDSTIRLWDVHFNAEKPTPNTNAPPQGQQNANAGPNNNNNNNPQPAIATNDHAPNNNTVAFRILPTDPLTNSHTPRAASCVRTFFGHVEGIWALAADHLRLISGSEDRMMKVWDPRSGKCERTFTGHAGPVTCCWLSDWGFASGSEDCEVRMLCFGDM